MTTISDVRTARLAQEPMRSAGPQTGLISGTWQSVKDIVAQRELLNMLIRRELKARYKDSSLGFVWSLIRPLAMLLIYYVALGKFLGAARGIPQFAIFIYTGLTVWGLFSEIVATGTSSIVSNSGLIKKVYLPREVFPLAAVGSALFNFAIQMGILLIATVVAGAFPTGARWAYFPLALAVTLVLATALALLLSAINVYLRDVGYLVEIFLMIAFWASPTVYAWVYVDANVSSELLKQLYLLNPMTLSVIGFQQAFWVASKDQVLAAGARAVPPNLELGLWIWLGVGLVLLWLSQRVFSRLQANFAQEL
jgi:ABC-2 type transport system permease protein